MGLMVNMVNMVMARLVFFTWPVLAQPDCSEVLSKHVCLPKNYSKYELPNTEETHLVEISFDLDEIHEINDETYSITFSTYLVMEWTDRRLHVDQSLGSDYIPLDVDFLKSLWVPKIFVYNLKKFEVVDAMSKLDGLMVNKHNNVFYSQLAYMTFLCPMQFNNFPFDTHTCKIRVGSYSYNSSRMDFITKSFGYNSKSHNSIALPYDIGIKPLTKEDGVLNIGAPSTLAGFEIVMSRYSAGYVLSYYFPSGLLVLLSWISFLIPQDRILGRMALLVTLLLMLMNVFHTVTTTTPKGDACLTALETWLLACLLLIFGAIMEYSVLLLRNLWYSDSADVKSVTWLDKVSLIIFPSFFLLLNIFYWPAYLS